MSTKRKRIIFAAVILVVIAAAAAFYLMTRGEEAPAPTFHSQLTGVEVDREVSERPILGIMIENTPAARPQTGLDAAGIVFEVVTEGGITRTLALYQENMPEDVGPIRSLRPFFVDWLMGFDASVAHVGGSGEALELAEERGAKSLDQFRHSEPYYRTEDREAPHNMYARTQDLRDLQDELGHDTSQFREIPRSDDSPGENPSATEINIDYSSPEYEAQFLYQSSDNTYIRHLAGEPHIDNVTGQPISVKNIVVIKLPADDDGIDAIGSGEALVFKNGEASEVRWQKNDYNERIVILNDEGNQVPLNRGDSWFAVLPGDRPVTY